MVRGGLLSARLDRLFPLGPALSQGLGRLLAAGTGIGKGVRTIDKNYYFQDSRTGMVIDVAELVDTNRYLGPIPKSSQKDMKASGVDTSERALWLLLHQVAKEKLG